MKNSEECDIDLTLEKQSELFAMLSSTDLEMRLLALNLISTMNKTGVYLNVHFGDRSISFQHFVRFVSGTILLYPKVDPTYRPLIEPNEDLLNKLLKY